MIISFETSKLLELCCRIEAAEALLGVMRARLLTVLVAEAEAFDNALELITFLGHDANIAPDDSLLVRIGSDYQALFIAVGTKFKLDHEGKVDWATVRRLKLLDLSEQK